MWKTQETEKQVAVCICFSLLHTLLVVQIYFVLRVQWLETADLWVKHNPAAQLNTEAPFFFETVPKNYLCNSKTFQEVPPKNVLLLGFMKHVQHTLLTVAHFTAV